MYVYGHVNEWLESSLSAMRALFEFSPFVREAIPESDTVIKG